MIFQTQEFNLTAGERFAINQSCNCLCVESATGTVTFQSENATFEAKLKRVYRGDTFGKLQWIQSTVSETVKVTFGNGNIANVADVVAVIPTPLPVDIVSSIQLDTLPKLVRQALATQSPFLGSIDPVTTNNPAQGDVAQVTVGGKEFSDSDKSTPYQRTCPNHKTARIEIVTPGSAVMNALSDQGFPIPYFSVKRMAWDFSGIIGILETLIYLDLKGITSYNLTTGGSFWSFRPSLDSDAINFVGNDSDNVSIATVNGNSVLAGVTNIVAALAGYKVRVYGFSIGANAVLNTRWQNTTTGVKCYNDSYGDKTRFQQCMPGSHLFETANDRGLDLWTDVVTPFGVSLQYRYIPN